jgi:hypothetical protein
LRQQQEQSDLPDDSKYSFFVSPKKGKEFCSPASTF